MELTLLVIATFLLSAAAGWLTIPRIVMISKKKKLFDELSARKSHTGAVPRLGGVSFLPAFLSLLPRGRPAVYARPGRGGPA